MNLGDSYSLSAIAEILSLVLYRVRLFYKNSSFMLYRVFPGMDIFVPPEIFNIF